MRHRLIQVFALLVFVSVGVLAAGPSAERTDELMHKSGLWNQLAEMAPLFAKGVDDASSRMGGANTPAVEALRQAFATAYAADRLRPVVARQLALSLSAEDVDASLEWLSGDLGQRITALEEKASTPEALRERMETGAERAKALSPERLAQYTRLAEAIHAGEVGATIMINTASGLARGFNAALPGHGGADADQVRALMETRRPQLVALMAEQQIMFFAMSYATVSDDELERYIAFAESPVGRRYQAATVVAVDKAMTDAAVETGHLLVSQKSAQAASKMIARRAGVHPALRAKEMT